MILACGVVVRTAGFVALLAASTAWTTASATLTPYFTTLAENPAEHKPTITVTDASTSGYLAPAWTGSFMDGADLALIKLPATVAGISSYQVTSDPGLALGRVVTIAGYGKVDTGTNGHRRSALFRRYGRKPPRS